MSPRSERIVSEHFAEDEVDAMLSGYDGPPCICGIGKKPGVFCVSQVLTAQQAQAAAHLDKAQLSRTVVEIAAGAFKDLLELEELYIPESVRTIGRGAFKGVEHIYYYGSATWEEDDPFWGANKMNDNVAPPGDLNGLESM